MIIFEALDFIQKELNAFLKKDKGGEPVAVLANLVTQNGAVPTEANNKIVLSLLNVEREAVASQANFISTTGNGNGTKKTYPPLNLNLYLLVTGNNTDYNQALKMLSKAVSFFQAYPVFTPETVPTQGAKPIGFPKKLQRLTFEVYNLKLQEMSHLWGALGAKYQPSIIYKVRMLTIHEAWVLEERPAVKGGDTQLQQ